MSDEISRIEKKGESETVEFRGARTHIPTLARSICGMLNQQGGVILWGIGDDGEIVGLEDAESRGQELNNFIAQHLTPSALFSIHQISGKHLAIINIPQGADKPYSLQREIWVRVGRSTLKADREVTSSIVERSAAQLERWERDPMPGFSIEDCDAKEIVEARSEIARVGRFGVEVPDGDEELLRRLGLARSGQYCNAAVVLFAKQPRAWAPNLAVRLVTYGEDKSGPIGNDTILEGPAIRVLKEAVTVLQQRAGFSGKFKPKQLTREDRPAYALFALREGLVNAMVHRDYSAVGGSIHVEVFPDRLTIQNPGRLPDGWSTDDLKKKHGSHPGNPDIARVFYLRELMEQLGMGTQKLIAECKNLGADTPVWEIDQNSVSLTLFRAPEPKTTVDLSSRQRQFLQGIGPGETFRTADYAAAETISSRQARRELAELEEFGLIEKQGKGRATVYLRTNKTPT